MPWRIYKKKHWNIEITNFKLNTFYNISPYENFQKLNDWDYVNIIYIKDNLITSISRIYYKKIYLFKILTIPGGVDGLVNREILNELANFIKSNFGIFNLTLIDIHQPYSSNILSPNWLLLNKYNFKTFIKDLNITEDKLLSTFSKNFRHNVNRSFKGNYTVITDVIPNINEIYKLYQEMEHFKKIKKQYTFSELEKKITIMKDSLICFEIRDSKRKLISFRAIYVFNNLAWDYLAATSPHGRKNYASYHLIYSIFNFCIKKNINFYDLSGVDDKSNLGVYNFKKGTGGDLVTRFGHFCYSPLFFIKYLFKFFYLLRY